MPVDLSPIFFFFFFLSQTSINAIIGVQWTPGYVTRSTAFDSGSYLSCELYHYFFVPLYKYLYILFLFFLGLVWLLWTKRPTSDIKSTGLYRFMFIYKYLYIYICIVGRYLIGWPASRSQSPPKVMPFLRSSCDYETIHISVSWLILVFFNRIVTTNLGENSGPWKLSKIYQKFPPNTSLSVITS